MEDCINSASTYDTNTILYYSYCFHTRIQYPEETFIDFLNDIIELANLCDFEAKNRMIRDQIVVGLRDSNVRKELFKLGNPKLDELLEYLNGVENSQKIVTEASNNEDESYSYEDVHEDEQSKNVKLEFCDMEINEDCTMDDQDFHASSESLQEKNLDIKTDKTESKEIENSQLNEEKSSLTSYTLHSYIIKKEIDDNVDDKSDSDESSAENWDVSHIDRAFGISGDKDSFSDNSTTSNQCVPDGYQKEDESSEILNKAINIAELEKIEAKTENESNVFTIENKPVNLELEAGNSIKSKFPKRKIHKVIDVIELDDSDDEVDFKGNFNSNVAEKLVKVIDLSSEILPIKKEEKKCVDDNAPSLIIPNNNSVPNAKSELDIESKNTKELCDKTKVTAKENVTRKNSYRYFCSECNKNFSSKYVLKNHVLRHLGEAPYKCSYCLKIFSYSQNLNTHMLIHTNQKPYKCQECDKCFRQKANLDAHAIRHADKKLLECKEEIETVEENETSKKIRKKRGRKKCEQSLTCKKCNKSLSSVQALRLHQFTHFGIKPYECDYCDKKYAQSHTLRTHLLVHTGERPYSCDECTKSFRSKGILKAHMLIHKNDKLFSCSVCMKSFKRKSGYKAHMVVHTKEKL